MRVHFSIKLISIAADAKLQEINHRTSSTRLNVPRPRLFVVLLLLLLSSPFLTNVLSYLSIRTLIFALSSICREWKLCDFFFFFLDVSAGGAYRVVMSKSSKRTSAGKGINGGTNVNRYSRRRRESVQFRKRKEEAAKRKLWVRKNCFLLLLWLLENNEKGLIEFPFASLLNLPIIIFVALPSRNGLKVAFRNFWPRRKTATQLCAPENSSSPVKLPIPCDSRRMGQNRTYWKRFFILSSQEFFRQ